VEVVADNPVEQPDNAGAVNSEAVGNSYLTNGGGSEFNYNNFM